MSRLRLSYIALATLVVAGCGAGGRHYWLYAEPRLAEAEEAVFVAQENHQLQTIDGQETFLRCWGRRTGPQAYRQNDALCRLHILPGQHTVVFHAGVSSRERVSLSFTALAGKVYGLDRSACSASIDGRQQTCLLKIMEIEKATDGG